MRLAGYGNVSHEIDSSLNISPKMSHGVLECDIVMLHAYDFVIKDFVLKKRALFVLGPVFKGVN